MKSITQQCSSVCVYVNLWEIKWLKSATLDENYLLVTLRWNHACAISCTKSILISNNYTPPPPSTYIISQTNCVSITFFFLSSTSHKMGYYAIPPNRNLTPPTGYGCWSKWYISKHHIPRAAFDPKFSGILFYQELPTTDSFFSLFSNPLTKSNLIPSTHKIVEKLKTFSCTSNQLHYKSYYLPLETEATNPQLAPPKVVLLIRSTPLIHPHM